MWLEVDGTSNHNRCPWRHSKWLLLKKDQQYHKTKKNHAIQQNYKKSIQNKQEKDQENRDHRSSRELQHAKTVSGYDRLETREDGTARRRNQSRCVFPYTNHSELAKKLCEAYRKTKLRIQHLVHEMSVDKKKKI